MIRLLMTDGTRQEVPEASTAYLADGHVLCCNETGDVVARFAAQEVTAFGAHPSLAASAEEDMSSSGGVAQR